MTILFKTSSTSKNKWSKMGIKKIRLKFESSEWVEIPILCFQIISLLKENLDGFEQIDFREKRNLAERNILNGRGAFKMGEDDLNWGRE